MALSATFTANFSSFYDAVDKAEAKLKDFGAGADKVGPRLNALANQFSGQKIVQEATLMAKAVEEIGGVSKLTDKELARLGATANEAVAKMKLLGMDVPKNLQEIADKTKGANAATSDWMGTFAKMGGVIAGAFSIGAITNFIGSVFDAAGAIKDLSDQWGFSTLAVQKWVGAAKLSGVEAATVGKSVQFMTDKLSESSDEYTALLANIGLSGAALKKMPLEDAYREVLKALTDVKDETLQYDLALGLIGPSAKQMIGAIRDGLVEATAAQKGMSDETIARLEAAGDAWEKFKNLVVMYTGEMLAETLSRSEIIFASWGNFFQFVKRIPGDVLTMRDTAGDWVKLEQAAARAAEAAEANRKAIGRLTPAQRENMRVTEQSSDAIDVYGGALGATGLEMGAVTRGSAALGRGMKTTKQVTDELAAADAARKKGLKDLADETAKAKQKQDDYNKSVDELVKTLGGGGAIDKANLYVSALRQSIPIADMTKQQQIAINKVMWEAIVAYEAAGKSAPKVMYDIWTATAKASGGIKDFQEDLSRLWQNFAPPGTIDLGKSITLDTVPIENQLDKLQIELNKALAEMGETPVPLEKLETSISRLGKSFGQLGQIAGGAFGDIVGDIGTTIGSMELASEASDVFQAGIKNFDAGNFKQGAAQIAAGAVSAAGAFLQATQGAGMLQGAIQGAAAMALFLPPYGAAIGFAAGALRGFFNEAAKKQELTNLKDEIQASAGGLQFLAERAEHAGAAMALIEFRNAETGGAVEAAVNKMNAAFQFQDEAMKLVISTAEKYGFTLEQLGPAFRRQELDKQAMQLYQDWQVLNQSGLETVEITNAMADSVNEYVKRSIAMGVEVPSAMRPMLEQMAKSGELLDENGEKITDLEESGISFALTMSDGFKVMVNEVKKLTDAITRGLGLAIADIPRDIKIKGTLDVETVVKPPSGGEPAPSQPHGGDVPEFERGSGGFRNFGAGTPAILHGWEAVVPREDAGAFATVTGGGSSSSSGAPAAATVVINAQGAFFDTPESLQRLATKVSDALTAKYSVMGKLRAAV